MAFNLLCSHFFPVIYVTQDPIGGILAIRFSGEDLFLVLPLSLRISVFDIFKMFTFV